MIKSLIIFTIFVTSTFALTGQSVYENKCTSCHQMKGMIDMSQMKAMQEKMENSGVKAPAMNMISMRIKKIKGENRTEFVAFVKDYIQNPSQDKGVCMPMAYKRFGEMPPVGKAMSEEEMTLVAEWLYDTFKGKWADSKDGKICDSNNGKKLSKCGGSKVVSTRDTESKSTRE